MRTLVHRLLLRDPQRRRCTAVVLVAGPAPPHDPPARADVVGRTMLPLSDGSSCTTPSMPRGCPETVARLADRCDACPCRHKRGSVPSPRHQWLTVFTDFPLPSGPLGDRPRLRERLRIAVGRYHQGVKPRSSSSVGRPFACLRTPQVELLGGAV